MTQARGKHGTMRNNEVIVEWSRRNGPRRLRVPDDDNDLWATVGRQIISFLSYSVVRPLVHEQQVTNKEYNQNKTMLSEPKRIKR